ncbi:MULTISPECIES: class I SAM-dependent methyltransferase [unclassified Streptomyces]|uniref:class I SAM-dependent methyltransferase n=1 Tax=unclassified Streptomyces TaxID=2593676 RepID=UPI0037F2FE0D
MTTTHAVTPDVATWNRWHEKESNRLTTQPEEEQFLTRVAPTHGQRAVDLGCGTGEWTRRLGWWGMQVVGYDNSLTAIQKAHAEHATPDVTFELWDVDSEPIPKDLTPGSLDLVSCRLSLPYFDRQRLLVDAGRWLAPWGTFYAITPIVKEGQVQDLYHRGLTFAELDALGTGWSTRVTWLVNASHMAIALTGYGG